MVLTHGVMVASTVYIFPISGTVIVDSFDSYLLMFRISLEGSKVRIFFIVLEVYFEFIIS